MFIKLTAGGDPLERTYFLSEDNRFLRWNSNFWAFKSLENRQSKHIHNVVTAQCIDVMCFNYYALPF